WGDSVAGRAFLQAGMASAAAARTIGRKRRMSVIAGLINSESRRPASRLGAGALSAHGSTRVPSGRETPRLCAWFRRGGLLFTFPAPTPAHPGQSQERSHLEPHHRAPAGAPEPTVREGGVGCRRRTHRRPPT